jgi:hypothetical protein
VDMFLLQKKFRTQPSQGSRGSRKGSRNLTHKNRVVALAFQTNPPIRKE